jgi:hypothetical protein
MTNVRHGGARIIDLVVSVFTPIDRALDADASMAETTLSLGWLAAAPYTNLSVYRGDDQRGRRAGNALHRWRGSRGKEPKHDACGIPEVMPRRRPAICARDRVAISRTAREYWKL